MIILHKDEDVERDDDHHDVEATGHEVDGARVPVQGLEWTRHSCNQGDHNHEIINTFS